MSDLIAGADEAGRGPLVGPVFCAAVILDPARPIQGLADSKALSESARKALALEIRAHALSYCVIAVSAADIDQINILQASLRGMARAIAGLSPQPSLVLIDGNRLPKELKISARAIVKGDASEPAISAASILAKTERDAALVAMEQRYPGYGFAQHKGYPTPEHLEALKRLGPIAEHRRSFAPVRALLQASLL